MRSPAFSGIGKSQKQCRPDLAADKLADAFSLLA